MKAQVDSGPPNKPCNDEEYDSISRKPKGKKDRHHERKISMSARKTWVEYLSRAFGEFPTHLKKQKRPLTLRKEFEAIDDCRLNRIEKNKITEDFSLSGYNPAKKDEDD